MLTSDFQIIIVFLFLAIVTGLAAYAVFCGRKSRSYTGTGRVAEIEAWDIKATISWILTFGVSIAGIMNLI